jgi:replicative DNA helicase
MNKDAEKFQFIELEKDSLKAFMQDRKLWVDLKDHIDPYYYNDKSIIKLFKLFTHFFNKYKDFPTQEQCHALLSKKNLLSKDVKSLLQDIYNEGDLSHKEIQFIKDEMNEFIKISKLERAILASVDLIEQKKYTEVNDIVSNAVHWNPEVKLGTDYSNAEKRYAALGELMTNIIETPWSRISYFLGGGFYRKELYLFAASSSVGKSIALDQIALHCWDFLGLDVALATFEMSEERKGQRMDACKFGIPVTKVYDKRKEIITSFEKEGKKNRLFIKEFPQTASTADIEQWFYQLELYEGIKPHILITDYMDIMSPRRNKTGKDYDDQGAVGADLRDFAKEYNIPVVSASQFNRTVLNKPIEEVDEGSIGESWKKVKIADALIAMGMTAEERLNGIINMKGVKNRNGPKDWIANMQIQYEYLRIVDQKQIKKNKTD